MATSMNRAHFLHRCFKNIKLFSSTTSAGYQTSPANSDSKTVPDGSAVKFPEIIFSGIQPTGGIHLGNYFGAVKRWVDYQNSGKKTIYSIVDLHSMTTFQQPSILRSNIHEIASCLLACGIDPEKSIFFIQSRVAEHSQLAWILSCLMSLARLDNLPQYKEKSSKVKEIPLGLLAYPVLQSADVLLYKATHVPVGEDQLQHLQITRHLARIFNKNYGNLFPEPIPLIGNDSSSRLRSLRNPEKKMSKSEENPFGRISITDPPDIIKEKIKKAVTDCTSAVTFDPQLRPGVSNLITIHSLVTGKDVHKICNEAKCYDTGQYKTNVAEALITYLEPIRKRMLEYLQNPDYVESVLKCGAAKATEIAQETWNNVLSRIGTGYSMNVLEENKLKEKFVQ